MKLILSHFCFIGESPVDLKWLCKFTLAEDWSPNLQYMLILHEAFSGRFNTLTHTWVVLSSLSRSIDFISLLCLPITIPFKIMSSEKEKENNLLHFFSFSPPPAIYCVGRESFLACLKCTTFIQITRTKRKYFLEIILTIK